MEPTRHMDGLLHETLTYLTREWKLWTLTYLTREWRLWTQTLGCAHDVDVED